VVGRIKEARKASFTAVRLFMGLSVVVGLAL
jgi:hypothetical protein